jgi:hypothetical protein
VVAGTKGARASASGMQMLANIRFVVIIVSFVFRLFLPRRGGT